MYYDARPCAYNGLFDFYTNVPLKGYYPFRMFHTLYQLKSACKCASDNQSLYAAAAQGENSQAVMISYYTDDDDCVESCDVRLDFSGSDKTFEVFLLDRNHNAERVGTVAFGSQLRLEPNTVCLLRSIPLSTK